MRGLLEVCVIPWPWKEMGYFADFPLFSQPESARHLPSTFWITHRRDKVRSMAKPCRGMFKEPPAPD